MVICPECGYPYPDNTYVLGARDIICSNCKWKGQSTELLQTKGDLDGGVRALQDVYHFLGTNISPRIAVYASQNGLVSADKTPENYRRIAKILSRVTRATFKEFLHAITDDAGGHCKEEVDESELH